MYITNYKRQNSNLSVHRQTTTLCDTTKPHGKARKKTISRAIYYQINSLLRRQGTQTELTSTSEWDHYSQVKINDNIYSSTSYKRSKRSSNTIQVANNIFDFGTIHEFIGEQDTLFAIVNTYEKLKWPTFSVDYCHYTFDELVGNQVFPVDMKHHNVVISVKDIINKVILLDMKGSAMTFISVPTDSVEHD